MAGYPIHIRVEDWHLDPRDFRGLEIRIQRRITQFWRGPMGIRPLTRWEEHCLKRTLIAAAISYKMRLWPHAGIPPTVLSRWWPTPRPRTPPREDRRAM